MKYDQVGGMLERDEVKRILDHNFELLSELLMAIQHPRQDVGDIATKMKVLLYNLKNIKPYLLEQKIFSSDEYEFNLSHFSQLCDGFQGVNNVSKFFAKNKDKIQSLVGYFLNSRAKNKLDTRDIGFKINSLLAQTLLRVPLSRVLDKFPKGYEQFRNSFEIVRYGEEYKSRILFIPGIRSVRQDRVELTHPKFDQYDSTYFYDGGDKLSAQGLGTNFDGLFEAISQEYHMGVDFVSAYYVFEKKRIEEVIGKIQAYLDSEAGEDIEVILGHSYWAMIAQSLNLKNSKVKKVIQVAGPFQDNRVLSLSVPRESYANKLAKRSVEFYSYTFPSDNLIDSQLCHYLWSPSEKVEWTTGHCEGFYFKYVNPEVYRQILDKSGLVRYEE